LTAALRSRIPLSCCSRLLGGGLTLCSGLGSHVEASVSFVFRRFLRVLPATSPAQTFVRVQKVASKSASSHPLVADGECHHPLPNRPRRSTDF
jgi:hypothetical protein